MPKQEERGSTTLDMTDGMPAVGHGVVHYVCGDFEGCHKAMTAATRTKAVMGAGAGGFFIAGLVGVGTGVEWDLIIAGLTSRLPKYPSSVDSYLLRRFHSPRIR